MTRSSPEKRLSSEADETTRRSAFSPTNIAANPVNRMRFGLIYDSTYWHISAQNVRQALPEGRRIDFDLSVLKPDADIHEVLRTATAQGAIPDVIVQETTAPGLPRGLHTVSVPTACLDVDTFGWTEFRLKWAMLFDYVFTWHISYVPLFRAAGHPKVFALPHAVDATLFGAGDPEQERQYEVGFVGHRGLAEYTRRDRILARLVARLKMNDLERSYSTREMAEVYKRSKIVVNVSREEFPPEANMRCYEAMAAGALLITGMPTELTEWGFREGEHFIGWRSEEEIPGLVDQFLGRKEQREAIALAGQERTLRDFTYQRCVETIAETVQRDHGQLFAPARDWPADQVHLLYLSYYYRLRLHSAAFEEFRRLRRANPKAYWKGLPMVLKTLRHAVKQTLL